MHRPRFRNRLARAVTTLVAFVALTGCAAGAPGTPPATPEQALVAPTQAVLATLPATGQQVIPTAAPPATATIAAPPTATTAPTAEPTAGPTPRPPAPEPPDPASSYVVDRADHGRREIALTFDAGADRGFAEEILDILLAEGVPATFGITGQWASENPDLVARMAAEGHQIINHTWSHQSLTGYSTGVGLTDPAAQADELVRTNDTIADATGGYDTRPWFRPPYGDLDADVLATLAAEGYTVTVMWTCDSLGWNGLTAQEILDRCVATADPGDIVLMHVGEGAPGDVGALPEMITSLRAEGYDLVTVERLLQP